MTRTENHRVSYRTSLALMVLLAMVIAACSSKAGSGKTTGKSTAASVTIAYGSASDSSPEFKPLGDRMIALGTKDGFKMLRYDNNLDPAVALTNARTMVQQKANYVIDFASGSNNVAVGKVLTDAKIPCVAMNLPIPGCSLFNLDEAAVGIAQAEAAITILKARGWNSGNMVVVLLAAVIGGPVPEDNLAAFYSKFAQAFPGMTQASPSSITVGTTKIGSSAVQVDGKGTVADSYTATQVALQNIPAGKHVLVDALNDDEALGALRALTQAHRLSNSALLADSATAPAIQQIRSGSTWIAEASIFLPLWPDYTLAMAEAMMHGLKPPALTVVPYVVITKANVNQYYSGTTPTGAPPVPATDDYLKAYLPAADIGS